MTGEVALDAFFEGRKDAAQLFESVRTAIDQIGQSRMRVTKSQIAFSRRRAFAWVWTPDRYLGPNRSAPLVLSIALPQRDPSPRWKEVVEPVRGHWMHHLEIREAEEVDAVVRGWLARAWAEANAPRGGQRTAS